MDISEMLERIPKAELHCHLDGSIRPGTILDIARKEGISLPTYDINEFTNLVKVPENCHSLKEYLSRFPLYISVMQRPEYIYRITEEFLEDMWRMNVRYVEFRWAPFNHLEQGMNVEDAVESCLQAMYNARRRLGISAGLILVCMRNHHLKVSIDLVERCRKFIGRGVVAVDLAGSESDFPPEIHGEAFKLARKYGYHRTVHAAETGIPGNIITSVERLYTERIGHGVTAYRDEKVMRYVRENGIPLEICIVSNVQTGVETYESHPIKRYLDEGVAVTLNTDSITVSDTTLADTYMLLMDKKGFSIDDIKRCIMTALKVSFAEEDEKCRLMEQFGKEFEQLGIK